MVIIIRELTNALFVMTYHSSSTSKIEALTPEHASVLVQVLTIVLFATMTAIGAQIRIYVWEIPLTLQTLFVYGSGLILGARNGFLSMTLYLLMGLFFPVYAGSGHGFTYLMSSVSAGYLFGMPLSAYVIGMIGKRTSSVLGGILSVLAGSVVLFTCGVVWLHYAASHASWWMSIEVGWLRFVAIDAVKVLMVSLTYSGLRRWL
ncbi:MAG: biotin transporter BioY [Bacteroidetes bacterium]|nr:biotin transporter BioY [Bacteroidota bacterium]